MKSFQTSLLGALFLSVLVSTSALLPAWAGSSPAFHIKWTPCQKITATLTEYWHLPNLRANDYVLIVPHPPRLLNQDCTRCAVTVDGTNLTGSVTNELSGLHRRVICLHITRDQIDLYPFLVHGVPVRVVYSAALYREQIAPGPPATPIAPLDPATRRFALAVTSGIDYDAPVFQRWLDINGLRKRPGETDMRFAWRVFLLIKENYSYFYAPDQDRTASHLCQTNSGDCGGLSQLFVAALRANGIPARNLTGRMAQTAGATDNGQCHVEADFFVDGTGWVPVNMAPAAAHRTRSPYSDFGRLDGDFLAFHADEAMVFDSLWFGTQTIDGMQRVYHSVRGSGSLDGATTDEQWQVTSTSDLDDAHSIPQRRAGTSIQALALRH